MVITIFKNCFKLNKLTDTVQFNRNKHIFAIIKWVDACKISRNSANANFTWSTLNSTRPGDTWIPPKLVEDSSCFFLSFNNKPWPTSPFLVPQLKVQDEAQQKSAQCRILAASTLRTNSLGSMRVLLARCRWMARI